MSQKVKLESRKENSILTAKCAKMVSHITNRTFHKHNLYCRCNQPTAAPPLPVSGDEVWGVAVFGMGCKPRHRLSNVCVHHEEGQSPPHPPQRMTGIHSCLIHTHSFTEPLLSSPPLTLLIMILSLRADYSFLFNLSYRFKEQWA